MIKKDDVERMAELARIDLDEGEKGSLKEDLSGIIDYIDRLKKLDISGVLPSDDLTMLKNVTRDDIESDCDERKELVDDFTEKEGEYLKVRQIL